MFNSVDCELSVYIIQNVPRLFQFQNMPVKAKQEVAAMSTRPPLVVDHFYILF